MTATLQPASRQVYATVWAAEPVPITITSTFAVTVLPPYASSVPRPLPEKMDDRQARDVRVERSATPQGVQLLWIVAITMGCPPSHRMGLLVRRRERRYDASMVDFEFPGDLSFNREAIKDPEAFAHDAGAASWLFLCGGDFAALDWALLYAQV